MKLRYRRKNRKYDPEMVNMNSYLWVGGHMQRTRVVCRVSLIRKHKIYYVSPTRIY